MTSLTLPDPEDRDPTLTDGQLRLYLRPECCISYALQAVVKELRARREAPHAFKEERCVDCGGPMHLACASYDEQGECYRGVHG